jgi:tryptophan synthase beta chain
VAETLMPLVLELDRAYTEAKNDPSFQKELAGYLTHYVGRPAALFRRAL